METFKAMAARDILKVFHNSDEFSEEKTIVYDGQEYTVPVVVSDHNPEEWTKNKSEYSQGVYSIHKTVYIPVEALDFIPEATHRFEMDDTDWDIASVSIEMGELVLSLERYDE